MHSSAEDKEKQPSAEEANNTPEISRAYLHVRNNRLTMYELTNLYGGSVSVATPGSFRNDDDYRPMLTRESFNTGKNSNTSFTFTYSDLHCCACPTHHPLLGRDVVPVFVLSDQHFPAAVPAGDGGKCLAIVRIEDASLTELVDIFLAKIRLSWLPPGTVILIGAAGYLSGVGTAAYADKFAEVCCRLKRALPNDNVITHAPIIMQAGSDDPALIKSMADIAEWIKAGATNFLPQTTEKWSEMLIAGDEPSQPPHAYHLELPETTTDCTDKKIWHSEPAMPLKETIEPVPQAEETKIIETLVNELNQKFGAGISEFILTDRKNIPARKNPRGEVDHIILVGTNHAEKFYEAGKRSGIPSTYIGTPAAETANLQKNVKQIKDIALCKILTEKPKKL